MQKNVIRYLIDNGYIKDEDIAVFNYGLLALALFILNNGSVIIWSIIFKNINFGLIFLVLFSLLRITWGGYHCKTPLKCFLTFNSLFICNLFFYNRLLSFNYSPLNLVLIIGIIYSSPLLTKNDSVFKMNNCRKLFVCMFFLLVNMNSFLQKGLFLALINNYILHYTGVIESKYIAKA